MPRVKEREPDFAGHGGDPGKDKVLSMKKITIGAWALMVLAAAMVILIVMVAIIAAHVFAAEAMTKELIQTHAQEAIIAAQSEENDEAEPFILAEENGAEIGDFVAEPVDASVGWTQESLGEYKITHYCPCEKCCGAYANGITASGAPCQEGVTIACDVLPIGTRVNIGGQIYTVQDRFGDFDGEKKIDIYVDDHDRALVLGTYRTEVLEVIFEEV